MNRAHSAVWCESEASQHYTARSHPHNLTPIPKYPPKTRCSLSESGGGLATPLEISVSAWPRDLTATASECDNDFFAEADTETSPASSVRSESLSAAYAENESLLPHSPMARDESPSPVSQEADSDSSQKGVTHFEADESSNEINTDSPSMNESIVSGKEGYRRVVEELLRKIRLSSEVELLSVLLESTVGIWDGLDLIATLCPSWARHMDNKGQSNLTFHRLQIHETDNPTRLISYYAIIRKVRHSLTNISQQECILETLELLDAIRIRKASLTLSMHDGVNDFGNRDSSHYIPLPRETMLVKSFSETQSSNNIHDSNLLTNHGSQSSANDLLQLLEDIRTALDVDENSPPRLDESHFGKSETAENFWEVRPMWNVELKRKRNERVLSEWSSSRSSSKKRQRASTAPSQESSTEPAPDFASPCQGVCWDPTHQRWVAHWSDSRTHQRIRRYFNPKLIGFQHARLLAVMTRRDAVDSGRASMISKSERTKGATNPIAQSLSVTTGGFDDPTSQGYLRGIYWCTNTHSWFAYWRKDDELLYREFSPKTYLSSHDQDINVAIAKARQQAIEFRNSITTGNQQILIEEPTIKTEISEASAADTMSVTDANAAFQETGSTNLSTAVSTPTKVVYVSSPPQRPSHFLGTRSSAVQRALPESSFNISTSANATAAQDCHIISRTARLQADTLAQ